MTDMKKVEVVQLMNFHQTRDTRFDELRSEIDDMAGLIKGGVAVKNGRMTMVEEGIILRRGTLEVYDYLQRRAEEIDAAYTPEPCGRCAYYNKLLKTIEGE